MPDYQKEYSNYVEKSQKYKTQWPNSRVEILCYELFCEKMSDAFFFSVWGKDISVK